MEDNMNCKVFEPFATLFWKSQPSLHSVDIFSIKVQDLNLKVLYRAMCLFFDFKGIIHKYYSLQRLVVSLRFIMFGQIMYLLFFSFNFVQLLYSLKAVICCASALFSHQMCIKTNISVSVVIFDSGKLVVTFVTFYFNSADELNSFSCDFFLLVQSLFANNLSSDVLLCIMHFSCCASGCLVICILCIFRFCL